MNRSIMRMLAAGVALLAGAHVHAAITCNVTSPGFAAAYVPSAPTTNVTQSFATVNCTRGAGGDPMSVNWRIAVNNGLNPGGGMNRARVGPRRVSYETYRDPGCSQIWSNTAYITGTTNFSGLGSVSVQANWWGCIPAGQSPAANTYPDTVTMTLRYGPTYASSDTGTFPVAITTPSSCTLTTPPGNVVFNYVSMGPAQNAGTTFGVRCTSLLPYTMALDAYGGTLLGLAYTLSLTAASSTGTGAVQTHGINGNIAAGQSGSCASASCTASQTRTLTITY